MKTTTSALLLVTAVVFAACQYDPFAHRFVNEEPHWLEVEGVYVLTFQSVVYDEDRDDLESHPPCIVIGEHNRYQAVGYPVIQRDNGHWQFLDRIDKTGNWRGDTVGSVGTSATSETERYWGLRLDPHPISRKERDFGALHDAVARGDNEAANEAAREIASKSDWWDHPGDPALGSNEGVFELIFTYGDGDAGQVLIFTKQNDGTACGTAFVGLAVPQDVPAALLESADGAIRIVADKSRGSRQELADFTYLSIAVFGEKSLSIGIRYTMRNSVPINVEGDVRVIGHHFLEFVGTIVADSAVLTVTDDRLIHANFDVQLRQPLSKDQDEALMSLRLNAIALSEDPDLAGNMRRAAELYPENYPASKLWTVDIPEESP